MLRVTGDTAHAVGPHATGRGRNQTQVSETTAGTSFMPYRSASCRKLPRILPSLHLTTGGAALGSHEDGFTTNHEPATAQAPSWLSGYTRLVVRELRAVPQSGTELLQLPQAWAHHPLDPVTPLLALAEKSEGVQVLCYQLFPGEEYLQVFVIMQKTRGLHSPAITDAFPYSKGYVANKNLLNNVNLKTISDTPEPMDTYLIEIVSEADSQQLF